MITPLHQSGPQHYNISIPSTYNHRINCHTIYPINRYNSHWRAWSNWSISVVLLRNFIDLGIGEKLGLRKIFLSSLFRNGLHLSPATFSRQKHLMQNMGVRCDNMFPQIYITLKTKIQIIITKHSYSIIYPNIPYGGWIQESKYIHLTPKGIITPLYQASPQHIIRPASPHIIIKSMVVQVGLSIGILVPE